jgi:hypothetical protein
VPRVPNGQELLQNNYKMQQVARNVKNLSKTDVFPSIVAMRNDNTYHTNNYAGAIIIECLLAIGCICCCFAIAKDKNHHHS